MASKGKGREENHWQLNWWDLQHLVESSRRPVTWTKSSTIWTAHPTQPLILARHFPSSTQFIIPSPPKVVASLASYEPPTVISVAPTDDILFAYFPERGGGGVGCLWNRGHQLNVWKISEWWDFASGDGVVTAEWTNSERDWIVSESGSSTRTPPKGPMVQFSKPVLLLVTQAHNLHICYTSPFESSISIVKAPLDRPSTVFEGRPTDDMPDSLGGKRICTRAAIGLSYGDTSVFIATRSHILPSDQFGHRPFSSMDLGLPLDVDIKDPSNDVFSPQWESWGEEATIHVCEVHLECRGSKLCVATKPLPPISYTGNQLAEMTFVSTLDSSPALYLSVSFLDFNDYTTQPKSELVVFSFSQRDATPGRSTRRSKVHATRNFDNAVLNFAVPMAAESGILVGLLNVAGGGPIRRSKLKDAQIGNMEMLKLADLSLDEGWERRSITTKVDAVGWDVPVNVALSPNHTLLCSISSSVLQGTHTSIHPVPCRVIEGANPNESTPGTTMHIARRLVSALRSRNSPSDVIHGLSLASISSEAAASALHRSLVMLSSNASGLLDMWTSQMMGVAIEVYRSKSRNAVSKAEQTLSEAQWKVVHDLCSLGACCYAFELCREGPNAYDLDAIWQLVSLSSWFLQFIENIIKECILIGPTLSTTPEMGKTASDIGISPLGPIFIHLVHPYSLTKLLTFLGHVRRFRDYVSQLNPRAENSHLAKDVLMDLVDSSGVDLNIIESTLTKLLQSAKSMNDEDLRKSLLFCCPPASLDTHLQSAIRKVLETNAIDRPRLFIKPGDIVDGVSRLSINDQRLVKGNDIDVISKGLLLAGHSCSTCTRCGGRTQIAGLGDLPPAAHTSKSWSSWEKQWALKCVCGGSWTRRAA